ncbi:hypothetical protein ACH5RR_027815 [Cinchona calisaya]|uniref:Uncharacterized protein n=1 Tax=Cinchona calisaya TaxID=153742 RepID=A0ABD2YP04_9GENT
MGQCSFLTSTAIKLFIFLLVWDVFNLEKVEDEGNAMAFMFESLGQQRISMIMDIIITLYALKEKLVADFSTSVAPHFSSFKIKESRGVLVNLRYHYEVRLCLSTFKV